MTKKRSLLSEDDFKIDNEENIDIIKEDDIINLDNTKEEKENGEDFECKKNYNFPLRFKEDNYTYISLMSNIQGLSMTSYINNLIEKDKKKNKEKYEKLKMIERLRHKMMKEIQN